MVVRPLQRRPLCFLAAAVCPLRVRAVQTGDPWARRGRSGPPRGLDGFNKVVPVSALPLTPALREEPRDMVVLCHGPEYLARGAFKLNNLPKGRVDVLARCVSSAIFLSHGVREQTRIWLQLQEAGVTLCLDGGAVKGMHPDERSLAAAMKRTLSVAHGGAKPRDDVANGWSTRRGSLGALLAELQQQAPRPLLQLHEQGSVSLEDAVAEEEEEAELRARRPNPNRNPNPNPNRNCNPNLTLTLTLTVTVTVIVTLQRRGGGRCARGWQRLPRRDPCLRRPTRLHASSSHVLSLARDDWIGLRGAGQPPCPPAQHRLVGQSQHAGPLCVSPPRARRHGGRECADRRVGRAAGDVQPAGTPH